MKKIKSFSPKTIQEIKHYVYILTYFDENKNEKIFYVGKGSKNRVFESLNDNSNNKDKTKIIEKYKDKINSYIVKDKLNKEESLQIESLLINILRRFKNNCLTNLIKGHHTYEIKSLEEINFKYSKPINMENFCKKEKIKILALKLSFESYSSSLNKDFRGSLEGIWRLDSNKIKESNYIIGFHDKVIFGIYKYINGTLKNISDFDEISWSRWNEVHVLMGRPKELASLDSDLSNLDKNKKTFELSIISTRDSQKINNLKPNEKDKKISNKLLNKTINDKRLSGMSGQRASYYFDY